MQRQFTASTYILDQSKVLLIYHRKLQKWLPPGGHLEENELPSECAIREAREETGLHVELIPEEHCWIKQWNAQSFPRPYLCLLAEVPAYGTEPYHQHIDMIYRAHPIAGQIEENTLETDGIRWFSIEEIELLPSDVSIFEETKQIIRKILSDATLIHV